MTHEPIWEREQILAILATGPQRFDEIRRELIAVYNADERASVTAEVLKGLWALGIVEQDAGGRYALKRLR